MSILVKPEKDIEERRMKVEELDKWGRAPILMLYREKRSEAGEAIKAKGL